MTPLEFRLIVLLVMGWVLYRAWRRQELSRGLLSIVVVCLVVAVGVFIVYYGKLWHAWIFPVRDMPGGSQQ